MCILLAAVSPEEATGATSFGVGILYKFSFRMYGTFLLGDVNYGLIGTNNFLLTAVLRQSSLNEAQLQRGRIEDLPSINLYKMYQFPNTLRLPQKTCGKSLPQIFLLHIARFLALAQRLAFSPEMHLDFFATKFR